jgi:hypothetical protein
MLLQASQSEADSLREELAEAHCARSKLEAALRETETEVIHIMSIMRNCQPCLQKGISVPGHLLVHNSTRGEV